VNHDTSATMIERHYSRFITDHTDAMTRKALPNLGPVSEQAEKAEKAEQL
jgi:hypothetical protein